MIYAIGNIEGELELFLNLLKKVNFSSNDHLYILGDFVGDCYECVDYIKSKTIAGVFTPLRGCQENAYLRALKYHDIPTEERLWKRRGVIARYTSNEKLLNSHMKFFEKCPTIINTKDFIFSHNLGLDAKNAHEALAKIQKQPKLHVCSHYFVNDLAMEQSVYLDRNKNVLFINKNVNDRVNGGLALVNLQTRQVWVAHK